jgi:hypothetical protein
MKAMIGREDLIQILQQWRDGVLTAEQVHEWAEERAGSGEVSDWEGAEPNSVTNEVLSALDMLDINLMLPEDIPNYLQFLRTPAGQFSEGYRMWQDAQAQIDYPSRKRLLRATPLYARFCK